MTRQNFAMSTYLDRFMVIYIEIFTVENRKMWPPYCLSGRQSTNFLLVGPTPTFGWLYGSPVTSIRPKLPLVSGVYCRVLQGVQKVRALSAVRNTYRN